MTREEFIDVLDEKGYSYHIEGDKIIVTRKGHVELGSLTLPPGVEFKNGGNVFLHRLQSIPPDVEFNNVLDVFLRPLTSIPPGVEFNNGGDVNLGSITSLSPGVEFNNGGMVYLPSLIGGHFNKWEGNIEGINSKILLNSMISKEMFI
jgi:hypothetical protein